MRLGCVLLSLTVLTVSLSPETTSLKPPAQASLPVSSPTRPAVSSTSKTTPHTTLKPRTTKKSTASNKERKDPNCPFGSPLKPTTGCSNQHECQTSMNLNAYCSPKEICCQETEGGNQSLCYDRRLPLFGEPKCKTNSDCYYAGGICKSEHCCPNFHYITNEPLRPPTHFYTSNYSCEPGDPIPSGFHFAYCSNVSKTIAYLGVVDSCGYIQKIVKEAKCRKDSDCYSGYICAWIVDGGVCFRNPELCSVYLSYYHVVFSFTFASLLFMLLYFLSKAIYEYPEKFSKMLPFLEWQLFDVTLKSQEKALEIYKPTEMSPDQIKNILEIVERKVWKEEEKSMRKSGFEYVLNWFGYMVDDSEDEKDDDELFQGG